MADLFEKHDLQTVRYSITPRDYQHDALDGCFASWERGTRGVLVRAFTGAGKTIIAAMVADRWLQQNERNRVMIISYEKQLVWQFSAELEDVLGIRPGIEMESETADHSRRIVVASRASLLRRKMLSGEQREFLVDLGVAEELLGVCTFNLAKRIILVVKKEQAGLDYVEHELREWLQDPRCHHESGQVSRVHKFDPDMNWLTVYDEAHRHVQSLVSVGPIVEWFEKNPKSVRLGITATPKRSDNISIGSKMFPGIALDFPLWHPTKRCAVREGYAVPYIQKFVSVDGVDFADVKALAGNNQAKWDAEIARILETELATYCEPMLDMVDNRQTLIFNPSVAMAKQVADYVNARCKVRCNCGRTQWHVPSRVGDGATCKDCGRMLESEDRLKTAAVQAHALWGEVSPDKRREVYAAHQAGTFQFLSVCALAREGYNDPNLGAVAVFRPVSRKASSLAEQMKGRGSRPARGVIDGLATAEERLEAIAASDKPNCLIVDLVGVSGMDLCASTIQIYAEGEPDEVVQRAEELTIGGVEDPLEAIEQAKEELAEEKAQRAAEREERERQAREAAKRRAEARAQVSYTVHERGYKAESPGCASTGQLNYLHVLGLDIIGREVTKRQASRMIDMLYHGLQPEDVAYQNGIDAEHWSAPAPSPKQISALKRMGYKDVDGLSRAEASDIIHRERNGVESTRNVVQSIAEATTTEALDRLSSELRKVWGRYEPKDQARIRAVGTKRRTEVAKEEF